MFRLGPLLRGEIDPARIRDRVVIVGVTADSLPDFFHVPVASGLSVGKTWNGVEAQAIHGVELHGHFTSQLIRFGLGESRPLGVHLEPNEALLVLLAAALGCALARLGSSGALVVALLVVGGSGLIFAAGAIAFRAGVWVPLAGPSTAWLASFGLLVAWSSSQERTQRAALMRLFSRHVSPEVADEIWRQRRLFLGESGRPPSQRLVATVLFVDMKGYTASAEKLDPEALMRWVNEFMEPMAELVVRHGGVVDDYFGDGMKANFGVPFARATERRDRGRRAQRRALRDRHGRDALAHQRELPRARTADDRDAGRREHGHGGRRQPRQRRAPEVHRRRRLGRGRAAARGARRRRARLRHRSVSDPGLRRDRAPPRRRLPPRAARPPHAEGPRRAGRGVSRDRLTSLGFASLRAPRRVWQASVGERAARRSRA